MNRVALEPMTTDQSAIVPRLACRVDTLIAPRLPYGPNVDIDTGRRVTSPPGASSEMCCWAPIRSESPIVRRELRSVKRAARHTRQPSGPITAARGIDRRSHDPGQSGPIIVPGCGIPSCTKVLCSAAPTDAVDKPGGPKRKCQLFSYNLGRGDAQRKAWSSPRGIDWLTGPKNALAVSIRS